MAKVKIKRKQGLKWCSKVGNIVAKVASFAKNLAVIKDFIENL